MQVNNQWMCTLMDTCSKFLSMGCMIKKVLKSLVSLAIPYSLVPGQGIEPKSLAMKAES